MGDWIVSADLLARSRFLVSPLHETVSALTALDRQLEPADRAFAAVHRESYDAMLDEHPARRELGRRAWRPRQGTSPGWMADFLGPAPDHTDDGIESQLETLAREWPDARIRRELYALRPGRLPDVLNGIDLTSELVALLAWVWHATVETDWPRRERVLQADIVSRTRRLATRGWADVIGTLGRGRAWLAGGRLTINGYDLPDRDLSTAQSLSFIPVHGSGSWVAWEEPERYAIVYPVTGSGIPTETASGALGRLLGPNRATVLTELENPLSTTHLAALLGLPTASVSAHLRVMLDSGLVQRRRSGREVLYWRSALGEALVHTEA